MAENVDIRNLVSAFKVLGGNKDGRISYQRLANLLQQKMGLTKEEVSDLLESETCRDGDDLDFMSLCISILRTKVLFDRASSESGKVSSASKKVNNRTFTRRKVLDDECSEISEETCSGRSSAGSRSLEQSFSQDSHVVTLKGCVFGSDSTVGLSGHRYLLELPENSPVEIVAQAIDKKGCLSPSPPIEVLIFQENDEPNKKLVTFSSFTDSEGYCSVKVNLKKGKYLLVPVTMKWKAADTVPGSPDVDALVDVNDNGETVLTQSCNDSLKVIFDCVDLDRNRLLCQSEFDLFIQYICGESAADEWPTVEDNFDTVNGELSFDGFMSLYQMAILTDPRDAAYMFRKMGIVNSSLEKAFMFLLTVNSKVTSPLLKPLPVNSFEVLAEEVFRKTTMEQGYCSKIRNMNDLLLYTHKLPQRVTLVVHNKSHCKVKVKLDCRNSENCVSHRPSLEYTIEIEAGKSVIGHHLFPVNQFESWSVQCVESLVE